MVNTNDNINTNINDDIASRIQSKKEEIEECLSQIKSLWTLTHELLVLEIEQERNGSLSLEERRRENHALISYNRTLNVIPSLNDTVLPVRITSLMDIANLSPRNALRLIRAYNIDSIDINNLKEMKCVIADFLAIPKEFISIIQ